MVGIISTLGVIAGAVTLANAACPMAALIARGEAPEELAAIYRRGEHPPLKPRDDPPPAVLDPLSAPLSEAGLGSLVPRDDPNDPPPALLDPLSGPLSALGLGSLVPRSADPEHERIRVSFGSSRHFRFKCSRASLRSQNEHIQKRLNERDEDVDIHARVLTPKAAKRHFEERGLIGGLLAPLSGLLQHLDIPTPQDTGLKAIPGKDPNHQYQAPGPTDVRGNCPTLNTLANHGCGLPSSL